MAAATTHSPAYHAVSSEPRMSAPLIFSLIFHGLIIFTAIVGLPHLRPEPPEMAAPMSVEIVGQQDDKDKTERPVKAVQPKQIDEPPPPKPQMPKVTAKEPPKPVAPRPEVDTVAMPSEEAPKEVAKPREKPKTPPKPLKRPTLTREVEEEENQEEFKSVLRNLMDEKPVPVENAEKPDKPTLTAFAQSMTMGEQSRLQAQLSQCWSVLAGARFAEDIIVDIKLTMNPDRTIRDAQVADQLRYISDSYFQAAADAAIRAVRNPRCNPLDLPPEKYNVWKNITVTFDPRQML